MTSRSDKIVLLGNGGFIGSAVEAALLAEGTDVSGYSSRDLDLSDPSSVGRLSTILSSDTTLIFAAALTPDRGKTIDTFLRNVALVGNVARALESQRVRKCIYLSSDAVYRLADDPTTESSPVDPADLYALAKFTAEKVLEAATNSSDTPLLVLRLTGVYGPGDTHDSYGPNRFVRTLVQEGEVSLFGDGEELRDHIFIDDAVRLIIELSMSEQTGTLNVATGSSRSFGSIVELLEAMSPGPFRVVRSGRSGPVTHRRFDIEALQTAVGGFDFTRFEEGLRQALEAARGIP